MIDHLLGRPDPKYRKYQLLLVLAAWGGIILSKPHGPFQSLSRATGRRLTAWQIFVLAYMIEYARRNFARIVGLHSPEPLANKYNRDYFRATWVTTALDAGFWTAMRLKPKWVRDIASMIFTVYYLFAAEAADDKVRRVRGVIGVEHMRVSWNKGTTPYLAFFGRLLRPRHLRIKYNPRRLRIPRPDGSAYTEPIEAWMYFDGPLSDLMHHDKIILDIPGGGFVAMNPRCHDDKLIAWAAKTGFPVVSLNYRKAPEYPYPYALNECFDAYYQIHATGGRCIGLQHGTKPRVILCGDSAGGNLATALVLMLVQKRLEPQLDRHFFSKQFLPLPEAMLLIYPALDVNMTSWLSEDQSTLIEEPARRKFNRGLMRRQTEDYHRLADTPLPSEDEDDGPALRMTSTKRERVGQRNDRQSRDDPRVDSPPGGANSDKHPEENGSLTGDHVIAKKKDNSLPKPRPLRTKIKTTSMISYVDDRILTPELLRGMIFLYIGEASSPDFANDFLLSPLRAPDHYLREFPKVYMLTGEKDPLCDDTAIFAGRLRSAHKGAFQTKKEMGMIHEREEFDDQQHIHVEFIPGVSHGFLQFASVYHPAWGFMEMCSRWMKQAFIDEEQKRARAERRKEKAPVRGKHATRRAEEAERDYFSRRTTTKEENQSADASDNEDMALEMSALTQIHIPRQDRHHERRGSGGSGRDTLGRSTSSGNLAGSRRQRSRGAIQRPYFDGRLSPVQTRKSANVQSLKLTNLDNLLERRMDGVATGLMGDDSRPHTPY